MPAQDKSRCGDRRLLSPVSSLITLLLPVAHLGSSRHYTRSCPIPISWFNMSSNKTNFKTYEASTRLLAAVIATNKGLKLDFKELATHVGGGATKDAINHRLRPLKQLAKMQAAYVAENRDPGELPVEKGEIQKFFGESTPAGIEWQFRDIKALSKAQAAAVDQGSNPADLAPSGSKAQTPGGGRKTPKTPGTGSKTPGGGGRKNNNPKLDLTGSKRKAGDQIPLGDDFEEDNDEDYGAAAMLQQTPSKRARGGKKVKTELGIVGAAGTTGTTTTTTGSNNGGVGNVNDGGVGSVPKQDTTASSSMMSLFGNGGESAALGAADGMDGAFDAFDLTQGSAVPIVGGGLPPLKATKTTTPSKGTTKKTGTTATTTAANGGGAAFIKQEGQTPKKKTMNKNKQQPMTMAKKQFGFEFDADDGFGSLGGAPLQDGEI
ncbi:hypothetical protein GGR56DRAFT_128563 [Xylariaceae sp. FL0804]|nr:hypothetical protein GGR56DRAFT_128563 [Xylariaceae sp. FL0804]